MTFKEHPYLCLDCKHKFRALCWDYEYPPCPECQSSDPDDIVLDYDSVNQSTGVIGDSIPGGLEIRHGLCNADGTPKRYYSKTDIKRAANERGYTISGDSPKPYKVHWSGRQKRIDGVQEH